MVDIPQTIKIDAVNLCINYRIGLTVLEEMKQRGIKYCFFQPGADQGEEIIRKVEELGIVYQRGCMIVEPMLALDEEDRKALQEREKMLSKEEGGETNCSCDIL
jgi:predicted CoA-binding protein